MYMATFAGLGRSSRADGLAAPYSRGSDAPDTVEEAQNGVAIVRRQTEIP
jgi:hypothetical protein